MQRLALGVCAVILTMTACGFGGVAGAPQIARSNGVTASEPVRIRIFGLPNNPPYYFPTALTAGPDGAVWVADDIDQDAGASAIVRIAPSGQVSRTFHYQNDASPAFTDIVTGPDGALWLADAGDYQIVRVTTQGAMQEFLTGYRSTLSAIVSGPDKALWFTYDNAIGRITTSGQITTYSRGISPTFIEDIALGSDGALWFTEQTGDRIGRITPQGKVTEYSEGISPGAGPYSIAPGPDGALWFTEQAGRIGRITTGGQVTEYSQGITPTESPVDLAAGTDGSMWFTEYETHGSYGRDASKIGRITMAGRIREYSRLDQNAAPTGIVAGPDARLWFVETNTDRIGRITL
jgi:virginiamycin B lyase